MAEFLQFAFSGLTVGAIYALVALGFTLILMAPRWYGRFRPKPAEADGPDAVVDSG